MNETELGPVVVRREFDLEGGGKIVALVGQPYPVDEGGTWFCPVQLEGFGDGHVRRAGGVDSVQALLLALQMISALLYTSDEHKEGRLRWLGQRNLGLPVASTIADMVPPENE